jgi:hypothetical protein
MTLSGNSPQTPPLPSSPVSPALDQAKVAALIHQVKSRQNIPLGILGGVVTMIVCAVLWALITVSTDFQIGFMALGVGFAVGFAVRAMGKGIDKSFGYIGAVLSLGGCLLGNILTIAIVLSRQGDASLARVIAGLALSPLALVELLKATFQPMDLLFYALAVYEGYKFAFRRITPEEMAAISAGQQQG